MQFTIELPYIIIGILQITMVIGFIGAVIILNRKLDKLIAQKKLESDQEESHE